MRPHLSLALRSRTTQLAIYGILMQPALQAGEHWRNIFWRSCQAALNQQQIAVIGPTCEKDGIEFPIVYRTKTLRPSTMESKSLYEAIGVDRFASEKQIEAACLHIGEHLRRRKLAGDLTSVGELAIVEYAYETLLDTIKRSEYDKKLLEKQNATPYNNGRQLGQYFQKFKREIIVIAVLVLVGGVISYVWIDYQESQERAMRVESTLEFARAAEAKRQAEVDRREQEFKEIEERGRQNEARGRHFELLMNQKRIQEEIEKNREEAERRHRLDQLRQTRP